MKYSMIPLSTVVKKVSIAVLTAACLLGSSFAVPTVRNSNLLQDKVPNAQVLVSLLSNTEVNLISLEGGWALVEVKGQTGWLRASELKLDFAATNHSGVEPDRQGSGNFVNSALSLGVRALLPRNNRHALIINIGEYALTTISALPGTKHDRESATQIALAMQIPPQNITYLRDKAATGIGIRKEIAQLSQRVSKGDRVFVYYSGHGTRYLDLRTKSCVEAMLPHDATFESMISNRELATLLKPITDKADKVMLMYDACHSGGLIQQDRTLLSRGITTPSDEGVLTPKFSISTEFCAAPSNLKSRSVLAEQNQLGVYSQDIIHISASRDNEVSFEDAGKGGLATQFFRDCMLREAKDLDRSGAITIDEITKCAQTKIGNRLSGVPGLSPHHIQLNGNRDFVPTWFGLTSIAASQPSQAEQTSALQQISGAAVMKQVFDQRDAKHRVSVAAQKTNLKIGADKLDFTITSSNGGFVYVLMAGSDNQSTYLLFPNELDGNNKIEAFRPMKLPREKWQLVAGGPEGKNSLLVVVSSSARDISKLPQSTKAGPFVKSLNDLAGRAALGSVLSTGSLVASCVDSKSVAGDCSDAYGAALITIEETK
jgi:hypothetical protein